MKLQESKRMKEVRAIQDKAQETVSRTSFWLAEFKALNHLWKYNGYLKKLSKWAVGETNEKPVKPV